MRVFVTGGTGFVGPKVVNAIADAGHDVRLLERRPGRAQRAGVRAAESVQGDMTDADSLRRGVEGADVVVHLVAVRQGRRELFERVMVEGTRNLAGAAKAAGVGRFVLMSALGTGEHTKDLVPYYRAKYAEEQDVRTSGLEHVVFRPSFIFGRDGGILPTFRKLARLAPVTPVVGSDEKRIQPIWVDDVARYFAAAVDKPEAANRTFELGGPDVVTWPQFWQRLRAALGIRRRPSMRVPIGLLRMNALVTERLPGNIPLTRDLMTMLERVDNAVTNDDARQVFGFELVPLDEQLRRAG